MSAVERKPKKGSRRLDAGFTVTADWLAKFGKGFWNCRSVPMRWEVLSVLTPSVLGRFLEFPNSDGRKPRSLPDGVNAVLPCEGLY
jgi:hypothetical protein